jgi:hypothetical protein
MVTGILLSCSANSNLELCAMATAKLHALVQTRNMKDPEEGAYLLYLMNQIVQKAIKGNYVYLLGPVSSFSDGFKCQVYLLMA